MDIVKFIVLIFFMITMSKNLDFAPRFHKD